MIGINTSLGSDDNVTDDNLHHIGAYRIEPCKPHNARIFEANGLTIPDASALRRQAAAKKIVGPCTGV